MKGSEITLIINGVLHKVSDNLAADTTLNEFIRNYVHLKGTKFMCREGVCGSCVVTVKKKDAATGKDLVFAANSCLRPIFACHGWSVTTIEGIGNKITGYNEVQSTLASFSGTQCGYCSPGMVMNMYSLLNGQKKVSMQDVEDSFGGNICRCTGYRPILDAFKSLSDDGPKDYHQEQCHDIEDFPKVCPKTEEICSKLCSSRIRCHPNELVDEDFDFLFMDSFSVSLANNVKWYKVETIKEVFEVLDLMEDSQTYKLVAGSTAHGAYRDEKEADISIDISSIPELSDWVLHDSSVSLGANLTLAKTMKIFRKLSKHYPNFKYLKDFADHIDLIANTPVRNLGTLAGNLSLKNQHKEFPSDIYLMFVTVNALFTYEFSSGSADPREVVELTEFDLNRKLLTSFILPALDDSYVVRTYKIMPVAQSAIGVVNAGFKFKLSRGEENLTVTEKPNIIFGGISPDFVHAKCTESYLIGKNLLDVEVIQKALDFLAKDIHPNEELLLAAPAYRRGLAQSLFYKFVLSLSPESVNERYRSGGDLLDRPLSSGTQTFDTDPTLWPVNKPMPKLEAYAQTAGEAEFINDMPDLPNGLFGALVLAPAGPGTLHSIDTHAALEMEGVKAFYSAKHIPGVNSFTTIEPALFLSEPEPLFADKEVLYAEQPVGIIIATSQTLADKAADMVNVKVTGLKKPLLTSKEVLESGDQTRVKLITTVERKQTGGDGKHTIKGSFNMGLQYHHSMETQTCLTIPTEEGLDVYPASQCLSIIQKAASQLLLLPENCINVQNRRVGGSYGAKVYRAGQVALASALAAYISRKPVRIFLKMETNMRAIGKRLPCLSNYEVSVDDYGKIQRLNVDLYMDLGATANEVRVADCVAQLPNVYNSETWEMKGYSVRTDHSNNTAMRGPTTAPAVFTTENIIEHIAVELNLDPVAVRTVNLSDEHQERVTSMIQQLKESSDFENRKQQIEIFNKKNRWRKKGISLTPMIFNADNYFFFHALVSIYQPDGTVAITHGGIEMGQGINTKVAQVCAYKLGIDVSMVKIKPSSVLTAPNDSRTVGSMSSESVALSVIHCCDQLLERLKPVKEKLGENATWQEIIIAAADQYIDLCAIYVCNPQSFAVSSYKVYGVSILEVEVDMLTGNYTIPRCDVVEDAGISLSPTIDVGQVEGAFIMGLGYWLTEDFMFDPKTGAVLTDRSWYYKVPGVKDIPVDFRVTLLKNAPNPVGVLRSKATGEVATCMSCCAPFALLEAVNSARVDAGKQKQWLEIKAPYSPEKVFLAAFVNGTKDYKL